MTLVKLETPELTVIEESKAAKIKATFEPMVEMLENFEEQYNEILSESQKEITSELTQKAKRLRKNVGKVRIETGKLKDKQKEYIKLEDKAIMGVHNLLVWAVKEKEDKLKEIEDYFEIQEQKRIEKLQAERVEKLSKYVEDAHERNLADMEFDVWNAYFSAKKKEYEDRIEAEKKAEQERIEKEKAEAAERERIRKENEKLKKEREAYEAKLKAAREERDKIEREERQKREKLEAELKAKEDAERKEKQRLLDEKMAKEKAEKAALLASDKDKLVAFAESIYNLKLPELKNKEAGRILDNAISLLSKTLDYILEKAKQL